MHFIVIAIYLCLHSGTNADPTLICHPTTCEQTSDALIKVRCEVDKGLSTSVKMSLSNGDSLKPTNTTVLSTVIYNISFLAKPSLHLTKVTCTETQRNGMTRTKTAVLRVRFAPLVTATCTNNTAIETPSDNSNASLYHVKFMIRANPLPLTKDLQLYLNDNLTSENSAMITKTSDMNIIVYYPVVDLPEDYGVSIEATLLAKNNVGYSNESITCFLPKKSNANAPSYMPPNKYVHLRWLGLAAFIVFSIK